MASTRSSYPRSLRSTELVADPTNVLALECALRVRASTFPIASRPRSPGSQSAAPLEHSYYSGGLRYQLWVTAPDGTQLPLADGSAFDWLAKLASNRRAVYIASGIGAQLIALRFRAAPGE
jgi:hypothetical protein